ncbi:hypothetical protein IC620_06820 [Hazenella sp. IB182357]|uniref:Lipoprotein n=1 Tax=Polycladospora coralii TaxID=2771432 RepID=A0A926N6H5_9BACL|nr:hypothetical protein [Polycladospora coralii]MBD1372071.1 hypothetical protein [Polycladospora coralii]MBS7530577.1 hypothetical protein [Polycladospora coralii]
MRKLRKLTVTFLMLVSMLTGCISGAVLYHKGEELLYLIHGVDQYSTNLSDGDHDKSSDDGGG